MWHHQMKGSVSIHTNSPHLLAITPHLCLPEPHQSPALPCRLPSSPLHVASLDVTSSDPPPSFCCWTHCFGLETHYCWFLPLLLLLFLPLLLCLLSLLFLVSRRKADTHSVWSWPGYWRVAAVVVVVVVVVVVWARAYNSPPDVVMWFLKHPTNTPGYAEECAWVILTHKQTNKWTS